MLASFGIGFATAVVVFFATKGIAYLTLKITEKVTGVPAELRRAVNKLPGPKNKNWLIMDVDGNPLTKDALLKNGGKGFAVSKANPNLKVPIRDGYPVFGEATENVLKATVKGSQKYTVNRSQNFDDFDRMLAEQWTKNGVPLEFRSALPDTDIIRARDIAVLRNTFKLVWHEHQDMFTAQLIPSNIHTARYGGISHLGGISKIKEAQKIIDAKRALSGGN